MLKRNVNMKRNFHVHVNNINHDITIGHCSFEYALHIHDEIYEGAFKVVHEILRLIVIS